MAASTSEAAMVAAMAATRRAAAARGGFEDETMRGDLRIASGVDGVALALVIAARGQESARSIARRSIASDLEQAMAVCDVESLYDFAEYLLSSLDAHDAHSFRAIAAQDVTLRIRIVITLLKRFIESVGTIDATLRVFEELVQFDFGDRVGELMSDARRAIECLPELSASIGEDMALQVASALARIVDAKSVGVLFQSGASFNSVAGLRMFGEMMKADRRVSEGNEALENALVDDRMSVRREAFAVTTSLLNGGIFVDEKTLNKAEAEAKVDAIFECLVIQARFARDKEGDDITFMEAEAFEDAKDRPESHVLAELLPVVEVVLESMLSHSKWFKDVLELLERPKVDDDSSGTLESWITRLLFMHLQLSCGASRKVSGSSILSIASCARLLSDEAEWPEELQRHITRVCAKTLHATHVSSGDSHLSRPYSELMADCARQSVELLRDDWFALRGIKVALDPKSWSNHGALEAMRAFKALCEVAVSCSASSDPELCVLQNVMRASFTDAELEQAAKDVVLFSKPHLGRKAFESAGRLSKEAPLSGAVALFVTSLRFQFLDTYSGRDANAAWNNVAKEALNVLTVILPMTTYERSKSHLVEASMVMLEDALITMQDLPVELTCQLACVILRHNRRKFPLTDCVRTASMMLKIVLSYSLTSIPDEFEDLLSMINDIISELSSDACVDKIVKEDVLILLTPVLVKTGEMLWRHLHSRQRTLDDVESIFLELGSRAFDYCISAATELTRADGNEKKLESERRHASLVLAGARLHHCTEKMSRLYDTKLLGAFELKRRNFMVVCAGVFTNLRALQLLATRSSPLDRGLIAIGNALAMDDIESYADNLSRLGESVQTVSGDVLQHMSNVVSRENPASKPRKRIRNPYLDAVVAREGGGQDEYDDMADFIVCKPGRDYSRIV
ncbi:hypothetical protein BE221DRAFT_76187 [Ostreococcus tauri]|uniref:Uncharacterized protein n=1 Tax=Ostreococcus tauri TaxID=70448 RepID=A0A1Y5IG50_OSTTA|nr:hypothetical protein BE221DRAFT_76187 [Ostreococcus tauri]